MNQSHIVDAADLPLYCDDDATTWNEPEDEDGQPIVCFYIIYYFSTN